MFDDVDETLRLLLREDLPILNGEVDVAFHRPDRAWSGRLSRPTINLFLYDIRHNPQMTDQRPVVHGNGDGRSATVQRPPRKIDLGYLATAWTSEPDDEHRLLARVLATMFRHGEIDRKFYHGDVSLVQTPLYTRIPQPEEHPKAYDLWSVLDNEVRASLFWTVTAPLDVFELVTGPLVRAASVELTDDVESVRIGAVDSTRASRIRHIGGRIHARDDHAAGIALATLIIVGTTHRATSDDAGRYRFTNVPDGEYTVHIEVPGRPMCEVGLVVPAQSYDLELP